MSRKNRLQSRLFSQRYAGKRENGAWKNKLAILGIEAPGCQGAKAQEYLAYSKFSQHSQAGCIGV